MRCLAPILGISLAAWIFFTSMQLHGDDPITPVIELQSGPLTPALALDESPRPIHQVRVLVDARLERGTLVLDGNTPVFDEFGGLTGGIQTPYVRTEIDPRRVVQLDCTIELIKERSDKWRLYRIRGPQIRTPLRVATRGSIADGGPARLVVLDSNDKVQAVVECTRYGLAIP